MKPGSTSLYNGEVVHTRMRPVRHTLRYRVFSVMFDVDRLAELDGKLKLFSFNRFNLVSLFEKDFADGKGLRPWLDGITDKAGLRTEIKRYAMLCYPRILGFAFNPLTVYFGLDENDRTRLVIYEVRNTFGGRKTYAIPATPDEDGHVWQSCAKQLFVSPFNKVDGTYSFHVTPLQDDLTVGVTLKDNEGAKLKAFFRGHRAEMTDSNLLRAIARTGWMTIKVVAGIHFEAARLWLKGLRTVREPVHPETPVTIIPADGQQTEKHDRAA